MYFTFAKESSYGLDSTSQDYTIDLISEEVIDNMNYEKFSEFNYPTSKSRFARIKTVDGRIGLEFTYGNEGWNTLFESILGQKIRLSDFSLSKSSEKWNIVTGMLSSDITYSATSFSITEYKEGEFDNVSGVIVGSEYIAIGSIANGVVSASTRGSEASTASSHQQYDLVYGVTSELGRNVDIISRYRSGYCYSLPVSLTTMIYRDGNYFEFTGSLFSDLVLNADPSENSFSMTSQLVARNSRVISLASPSQSADTGTQVSILDINGYCMGEELDVERLYFQISNTLIPSSSKFFDTTSTKIFLNGFSAYGQFTLVEENLEAYNSYIGDNLKNLSMTICNSKQFTQAYVFSFNRVKYGTMLHVLESRLDVFDSVPFYSYDPEGLVILIQT